jgi:hypothetical protein
MLLIPIEPNLSLSHAGLSPTFMSFTVIPQYFKQSVSFSSSILISDLASDFSNSIKELSLPRSLGTP